MSELRMSSKQAVARSLRAGLSVEDFTFDQVYPTALQSVSPQFWTSVKTAIAAAESLRDLDCRSVLDIGSGVGKFCIISSLVLDRRTTGVEHRAYLVDAAKRAAVDYGADVECLSGRFENLDPERFDAFYLFNPFAENVFDPEEWLDDAVELSEARWSHDLAVAEHWLDHAPQGTALITYNGFGGRIPGTFSLQRGLLTSGNWLRVWTKRRSGRASEFFIEVDELVVASRDLERVARKRLESHWPENVTELLDRPLGHPSARWHARRL